MVLARDSRPHPAAGYSGLRARAGARGRPGPRLDVLLGPPVPPDRRRGRLPGPADQGQPGRRQPGQDGHLLHLGRRGGRGPGRRSACFGGEGDGWSCRIPYQWVAGEAYGLQVWTDGGGWWAAKVADERTGEVSDIGRIRVPEEWRRPRLLVGDVDRVLRTTLAPLRRPRPLESRLRHPDRRRQRATDRRPRPPPRPPQRRQVPGVGGGGGRRRPPGDGHPTGVGRRVRAPAACPHRRRLSRVTLPSS